MLRKILTLAAVVSAASLAGASGASAQYYRPLPPPSYENAVPDRQYIPLDDPEDIAPRRRAARPQALYGAQPLPRPQASRPQLAAPNSPYMDPADESIDLYSDPTLRSRRPSRRSLASLPSDADPAYSSSLNYDDEVDTSRVTGRLVADPTRQARGTLTIDTRIRKLYLSMGDGQAMEYGIGVGRQGFEWKGAAKIGRKAVWPGWTPPREMLQRRPDLPEHMEGGMDNPLGARALYLFKGNKDTLFRIHGTNEPNTIGRAVSSGCIRMHNADVIDLYQRVPKGANVVVL